MGIWVFEAQRELRYGVQKENIYEIKKIITSFRMGPVCQVQRAKITDNRHNLEPNAWGYIGV